MVDGLSDPSPSHSSSARIAVAIVLGDPLQRDSGRIIAHLEVEVRIAEGRSRRVIVQGPGFNLIHYRIQTFDSYSQSCCNERLAGCGKSAQGVVSSPGRDQDKLRQESRLVQNIGKERFLGTQHASE